MNKLKVWIASIFSLLLCLTVAGQGQYTPRLQTVMTGLSRPILVRGAADGSKRIFIVQQGGIIKVLQPGSNTPTDFINLSSKIIVPGSAGDERGLLGLAFHPQFATNGKFYVDYTRAGDGGTIVAEYTLTAGNPDQGNIASERILLSIPQPFSNHNGGMVEFGTDGYLYIGMGDGGSGNDPGSRAQNRSVLLGKILRIDVNVPNGSTVPYLIPPTNPYASGANTARCDGGSTSGGNLCQEIWVYGMRNPWRFSFDTLGTNSMWVADVGQGAIEEVDMISAGGGNYGWRVYEGNNCTGLDPQLCSGGATPITQMPPVFQYNHSGGRCSITGGYMYRGTQSNLPLGAYVYGDYCSGEILMWNNGQQTVLADTPRSLTSFGRDDDGEIYVCYSNGQVDKITRAKASVDFDGDFKTDISVFRPSNATWYIVNSGGSGFSSRTFGAQGDIPTAEDYDGDGRADIGVFRPSTGTWYYLSTATATYNVVAFGQTGDVPAAGDYDGDSKADLAVFRPSTGAWYVLRSSDTAMATYNWGATGDVPVAGDYDGDGKQDVAVWRPSTGVWYWINSTNNRGFSSTFGVSGDVAAPGDFDGDGKIDLTVFRASSGQWFVKRSSNFSFQTSNWGTVGDVPSVGDYDGDGRDDLAVFRPSNGQWYVIGSTSGIRVYPQWGEASDLPIPSLEIP